MKRESAGPVETQCYRIPGAIALEFSERMQTVINPILPFKYQFKDK